MKHELETWREIIQSSGWRVFKDLLEEHIEYLNNQSLLMIDKREFEDARDFRTRATECKSILMAVDGRLLELKNKEDVDG